MSMKFIAHVAMQFLQKKFFSLKSSNSTKKCCPLAKNCKMQATFEYAKECMESKKKNNNKKDVQVI